MNTFINPKVTIKEPIKNKSFGYFTAIDKKDKTILKIKSKSSSGTPRGVVGFITKDGEVKADPQIQALITSEVRQKIGFVLDMAFGAKRESFEFKVERGLVVR